MNRVILRGVINNTREIETTKGIPLYQAYITTQRGDNKEDLVDIRFKRKDKAPKDGTMITLVGTLRTFSTKLENKNKVELYVDTDFDTVDVENLNETVNQVEIEGFICKKSELRKTVSGKTIVDFILANNIETPRKLINNYIPTVAWGKLAHKIDKLNIGDKVKIIGRYQSRSYKKFTSEEEFEYRVAYELAANDVILPNETSEPQFDVFEDVDNE